MNLVVLRYILDEAARALPRLQQIQMSSDEIRDLVDSFMFLADMVEADDTSEPALRDAKDQKVRGTLVAAQASYFITGDKIFWSSRTNIRSLRQGCSGPGMAEASAFFCDVR